jgi:hypothetical protein
VYNSAPPKSLTAPVSGPLPSNATRSFSTLSEIANHHVIHFFKNIAIVGDLLSELVPCRSAEQEPERTVCDKRFTARPTWVNEQEVRMRAREPD